MENQVDQRHRKKTERSSKAGFATIGLVLAWFSVAALFHYAGIAWPGHANTCMWVIFLLCASGLQRIYSFLLWCAVLWAKPQWLGVGDAHGTH